MVTRAVVFFKSVNMLKCCKCEDRYETSKIYVKNFCQNSHIPVNENEKKYFVKNVLSLKNTALCIFSNLS